MTVTELQALETIRPFPTDMMSMVAEGRIQHQDAMRLCVGAKARHWHHPIQTNSEATGLMTLGHGKEFVILKAQRAQAFESHPCRKHSSLDTLASIIHTHETTIASRISWGVRRMTGYSMDTARDADGIWDPDIHAGLSYFNHSVLLGLAAIATRQGVDDTHISDSMASNYVTSIVAGRIPNIAAQPPEVVCREVLMCHTMVYNDAEIWRGWSTALPIKGMGYGCQSFSKKWDHCPLGAHDHYRERHDEHNLAFLVNGLVQGGIRVTSNRNEVIAADSGMARLPVSATYSPSDSCQVTDATTVMRTRPT
jgi:hypothetical protein